MSFDDLESTMDHLLQPGKGFLAADESTGTIGKRLATIGLENTEKNRRDYRMLIAQTPGLSEYIHGVILYEETFTQTDDNGKCLAQVFADQGITPGIKVDKGLIDLVNTDSEKVTQGLDGLNERLQTFKKQGATFAKWRNVYNIADNKPSLTAIKANAETLARYAAICQHNGIVPIVEPEVLMDGDHSIEQCAEAQEMVLHELFHSLYIHQVALEYMVLKPSMVTSGSEATPFSSPDEVALYTISVFRNNVPAAVPTINFLSGGQSPVVATENLNAMNMLDEQPWLLSFSYGRALQEDCLKAWGGKPENIQAAQKALLKRAKLNSLASLGDYRSDME
ncbi:class I fructose-bisphosphate aldolase [Legionella sp. W05-934-2]|uniref:class I fructose-bisphosphate aldolase n=1 Tax=Legionella sp. W05-934-2 TaxID=1198649 RepID=UPI003462B7A4